MVRGNKMNEREQIEVLEESNASLGRAIEVQERRLKAFQKSLKLSRGRLEKAEEKARQAITERDLSIRANMTIAETCKKIFSLADEIRRDFDCLAEHSPSMDPDNSTWMGLYARKEQECVELRERISQAQEIDKPTGVKLIAERDAAIAERESALSECKRIADQYARQIAGLSQERDRIAAERDDYRARLGKILERASIDTNVETLAEGE